MRVVITGASGFLGSHLVAAVLRSGHDVLALKRSTTDSARLAAVLGRQRLLVADTDVQPVEELIADFRPEAVLHTATSYGRGPATRATIPSLIDSNVTFPMRVLTSGVAAGARLFVNTDSYFNKPGATYNSLQGYSLTKKYFLDWLQHYSDSIRVVNMRLEHIYGPHDGPDKFIPTMVDQIALRRVPSFDMTPGEQARDFIHVADVVSAFLLLLGHEAELGGPGYDYFEVGTGATHTIREVALLIKSLSASDTALNFGALAYRSDEIPSSVASSAFHDRFGFTAVVPIEAGLATIIPGS